MYETKRRFDLPKTCSLLAASPPTKGNYDRITLEMSAQPTKAEALLLPADGSSIRLVSYAIKERDGSDIIDSGLAEFYDPIPNLKPWLNGAYQQRATAVFYVDTQKRDHYDPTARAFIHSDDSAACGQYCLYYTLSPILPHNETCKRILNIQPPSDRLFWRGNVLVVRYEGHLGLGHVYRDVEEAMLAPVGVVLQKTYNGQGLEGVHEEYKSFSLQEEMSRFRLRFPALAQAVDTGALEKLRTGQDLGDMNLGVLNEIPTITAHFPDGSEETLWKRLSEPSASQSKSPK